MSASLISVTDCEDKYNGMVESRWSPEKTSSSGGSKGGEAERGEIMS